MTGGDQLKGPGERALAMRAAWLHFVGGLRQADVAKRLDISPARAHRYIAKAQSDGLVRVRVDVDSEDCALLENRLMEAFGLDYCRVAIDAAETGAMPLRALSVVGAAFLEQAMAAGDHKVIGVGNGRTLSACVDAVDGRADDDLRFVSMLGGLTRSYAANPYDVIHKLARRTGAEAYLMPAPLYADTEEGKRVMLSQSGLGATTDLIARASLIVIGVGDCDFDAGHYTSTLSVEDQAALREAGAAAELLGQFLNAAGAPIATALDDRVMAPALSDLRGRQVVVISGGAAKTKAIEAALNSGLLTGLIIDEATARSLVDRLETAARTAAE